MMIMNKLDVISDWSWMDDWGWIDDWMLKIVVELIEC